MSWLSRWKFVFPTWPERSTGQQTSVLRARSRPVFSFISCLQTHGGGRLRASVTTILHREKMRNQLFLVNLRQPLVRRAVGSSAGVGFSSDDRRLLSGNVRKTGTRAETDFVCGNLFTRDAPIVWKSDDFLTETESPAQTEINKIFYVLEVIYVQLFNLS